MGTFEHVLECSRGVAGSNSSSRRRTESAWILSAKTTSDRSLETCVGKISWSSDASGIDPRLTVEIFRRRRGQMRETRSFPRATALVGGVKREGTERGAECGNMMSHWLLPSFASAWLRFRAPGSGSQHHTACPVPLADDMMLEMHLLMPLCCRRCCSSWHLDSLQSPLQSEPARTRYCLSHVPHHDIVGPKCGQYGM